jgi:hypothetical protein
MRWPFSSMTRYLSVLGQDLPGPAAEEELAAIALERPHDGADQLLERALAGVDAHVAAGHDHGDPLQEGEPGGRQPLVGPKGGEKRLEARIGQELVHDPAERGVAVAEVEGQILGRAEALVGGVRRDLLHLPRDLHVQTHELAEALLLAGEQPDVGVDELLGALRRVQAEVRKRAV